MKLGGIELRLNNVPENSSLAGYVTNHFELINRDGETAVFVDNPVDADEYYNCSLKTRARTSEPPIIGWQKTTLSVK